jgi:hypothetical protein
VSRNRPDSPLFTSSQGGRSHKEKASHGFQGQSPKPFSGWHSLRHRGPRRPYPLAVPGVSRWPADQADVRSRAGAAPTQFPSRSCDSESGCKKILRGRNRWACSVVWLSDAGWCAPQPPNPSPIRRIDPGPLRVCRGLLLWAQVSCESGRQHRRRHGTERFSGRSIPKTQQSGLDRRRRRVWRTRPYGRHPAPIFCSAGYCALFTN